MALPLLRTASLLVGTAGVLVLAPAASAAPTHAPATPAATARCGVDLSSPVIARAVAQLPRPRIGGVLQSWEPRPASGDFDPCARISGVSVGIRRGTASSPAQVLLFAYGRYLGTPAREPFPSARVDAAASTATVLVVHYLWSEYGDGVADGHGASTVRFRWNGRQAVRTGDLPPLPVRSSALLTAREVGLVQSASGAGVRPTRFQPCGAGAYPAEQHRVTGLWRELLSEQDGQPVEGRHLSEDVVRYSSADDVTAALTGYLKAARACPTRVDGPRTTTVEVLQESPLVLRQTTTDSSAPAPVAPTYYAFPRVGDLLALVETGSSEGDIGLTQAQQRARQARAHLIATDVTD